MYPRSQKVYLDLHIDGFAIETTEKGWEEEREGERKKHNRYSSKMYLYPAHCTWHQHTHTCTLVLVLVTYSGTLQLRPGTGDWSYL